jgi:hypothetical protein
VSRLFRKETSAISAPAKKPFATIPSAIRENSSHTLSIRLKDPPEAFLATIQTAEKAAATARRAA